MKSFLCTFFLLALALTSSNADTRAQEQCRRIHHVDAEVQGTHYLNNFCRLNCNIHGQIYEHNINEGQNCMNIYGNYVCHEGKCISHNPQRLGHIDIQIISASLYEKVNAYATVCIQNNSMPVHLPIKDRHYCISCSTHVKENVNYAMWDEICHGSNNYLFVNDARITIEVWDHQGVHNNIFLGGITLTIDQLLNHGNNHRVINLPMIGGRNPGQITTRITWTPRY